MRQDPPIELLLARAPARGAGLAHEGDGQVEEVVDAPEQFAELSAVVRGDDSRLEVAPGRFPADLDGSPDAGLVGVQLGTTGGELLAEGLTPFARSMARRGIERHRRDHSRSSWVAISDQINSS